MARFHHNRFTLTALGAAAALALYVWVEIGGNGWLAGRGLLAGVVATGVFFAALLAIFPRMTPRAAAGFAAALCCAATALVMLASHRYAGPVGLFEAGFPMVAAFVACALPLPFFIAKVRGNWRDYAILFEESWDIVLRFAMGAVLIGAVWALIALSDVLLSLVGLGFMAALFKVTALPFVITGAAGGFGIAVAAESLGPRGASLALVLLRPLLPAITGVVALFLLALPFRGLGGLFGGLSAGMTLLAMSAVAATLVSSVVDARDSAASRSTVLAISVRLMGVFMALLGGFAALAVGQRIGQYGWTPPRIYAAVGVAVSLGYGGLYAAAVVRADWMARLRQANVTMALALTLVSALLLTPILNAERISTNSQMARFAVGTTPVEALDIPALQGWGLAGQAAIAVLTAQSKQPGGAALALRLANPYAQTAEIEDDLHPKRIALAQKIPLQPESRRASAAEMLRGLPDYALPEVEAACALAQDGLLQSCVMIFADFLPEKEGDEALLVMIDAGGIWTSYGMVQGDMGGTWAGVHFPFAAMPQGDAARAAMAQLQSSPPVLQAAPLRMLPLGALGVFLLP